MSDVIRAFFKPRDRREDSTLPGGGRGESVRGGGGGDFSFGKFATDIATSAAATAVASALAPSPQPSVTIAGPTGAEIQAQKEGEELLTAQETLKQREREARQKVITARAAGPQTLFKREGEIPRAVKLGGGRRA